MRRILAVSTALVATLALGGTAAGGSRTVRISDYRFTPKVLHVARGTIVTWKWTGQDPHNVTGHGFRSSTRSSGTFRHRFTRRGTYRYVCTRHAKSFAMHGTIVVG